MRVHSPRLAASSSYRRKPVSRKPDWISCLARNDGPDQKTIPRGLPRGSSSALFGRRSSDPQKCLSPGAREIRVQHNWSEDDSVHLVEGPLFLSHEAVLSVEAVKGDKRGNAPDYGPPAESTGDLPAVMAARRCAILCSGSDLARCGGFYPLSASWGGVAMGERSGLEYCSKCQDIQPVYESECNRGRS